MKIKLIKRKYLRERVYFYYEKYKKIGKKFTVDHFINEGESKSAIYDITNRSESGKPPHNHMRGGRHANIFNQKAKN